MYKTCPRCGHERAAGETGAHDFIDVLGDLGLLDRAQAVGRLTHGFGVAMLIASFAWGAAMVWRQYGVRK